MRLLSGSNRVRVKPLEKSTGEEEKVDLKLDLDVYTLLLLQVDRQWRSLSHSTNVQVFALTGLSVGVVCAQAWALLAFLVEFNETDDVNGNNLSAASKAGIFVSGASNEKYIGMRLVLMLLALFAAMPDIFGGVRKLRYVLGTSLIVWYSVSFGAFVFFLIGMLGTPSQALAGFLTTFGTTLGAGIGLILDKNAGGEIDLDTDQWPFLALILFGLIAQVYISVFTFELSFVIIFNSSDNDGISGLVLNFTAALVVAEIDNFCVPFILGLVDAIARKDNVDTCLEDDAIKHIQNYPLTKRENQLSLAASQRKTYLCVTAVMLVITLILTLNTVTQVGYCDRDPSDLSPHYIRTYLARYCQNGTKYCEHAADGRLSEYLANEGDRKGLEFRKTSCAIPELEDNKKSILSLLCGSLSISNSTFSSYGLLCAGNAPAVY